MGTPSSGIEASVGHILMIVGLLAIPATLPQFSNLKHKLL